MIKLSLVALSTVSLAFFLQACSNPKPTEPQPSEVPQTHRASNSNPSMPRAPSTNPRRNPTPLVKPKPRPFKVHVNPGQIVSAHNKVRSKFRLQPLSWSPSLATFSTKWANHLKRSTGCKMHHRPHSGRNKTDFGENLYWASPFRWSDGATEVQKVTSYAVVNEWAKEVKYYNYQAHRCQPGQQCGHYTQIVWRDSKKVGCGLAICPDKSQVWVCSYDPPGNWQGQRPY